MSSRSESAVASRAADADGRRRHGPKQQLWAWVDKFADTALDIDVVSVINDVLGGWSTDMTRPRDKWRTLGGFLTYLLAVSAAITVITFFNLPFQPFLIHYFFPILKKLADDGVRQIWFGSFLLDTVDVLLTFIAKSWIAQWIALLLLGFAAFLTALFCVMDVLQFQWTWNGFFRGRRSRRQVVRLLGYISCMCVVQVAYHYVADNYFKDARLPTLRDESLHDPRTKALAMSCWIALLFFLLSFFGIHRWLYEKRREEDPQPAFGTVLALIALIATLCGALISLLFYYVHDYFEEVLHLENAAEEAVWHVTWILFVYCVIAPSLIVIFLQTFSKTEINAGDLKALRLIFRAAGFQEENVDKAIIERVTVNRDGRVIKILLHYCNKLKDMPRDIGELTELSSLNLEGCENLQMIPPEIGRCSRTKLLLEGCKRLKVPFSEYASNDGGAIKFMKRLLLFQEQSDSNWLMSSEPTADDKQLLFTAALIKSCDKAFFEACTRNKNLVKVSDHLGRSLIEVGCSECRKAMREASLFYKLYEFKKESKISKGDLKYESATSKVYFATLYAEDGSAQKVALKFMHNKEDLALEWNARHKEGSKENKRFDDEFVIPVVDRHDSDEFQALASNEGLPSFCLVLQRGERNLHEEVNAISQSSDMTRLRQIGQRLAKCLEHIHSNGYIHGDFKLKNIVWDSQSGFWKLIDFDAAVLYGEDKKLGRKFSTAYAPPELVSTRPGEVPQVRAPRQYAHRTASSTEDDFLSPSEKYDVWSYGAVLFHLIVGFPLFGKAGGEGDTNTVQDNLDLTELKALGNWAKLRDEKLSQVAAKSLSAKQLLEEILHPDPVQRPTMSKVLRHYFFRTDLLEQEIKKEKLQLEKQKTELESDLENARQENRNVEGLEDRIDKLTVEIALGNSEILRQRAAEEKRRIELEKQSLDQSTENTQELARLDKRLRELNEKVIRGFQDSIQAVQALDENISKTALLLTELRISLKRYNETTTNMLRAVIKNDLAPMYVLMLPDPEKNKKWWKLALKWGNPANWLNEDVRVYFVCPITHEVAPGVQGYPKRLLKGWVKKYGPALLVSLRVLKVACGIGRLTGLPLPVLSDVDSVVKDYIGSHTAALTSMYANLREDHDLEAVAKVIESQVAESVESYVDQVRPQRTPEALDDLTEESHKDIRRSYQEIKEIAKECGDPQFMRTGLEIAYHEGKPAFVRPDVKHLYEKMGGKAFGLSADELHKHLHTQWSQDVSETEVSETEVSETEGFSC